MTPDSLPPLLNKTALQQLGWTPGLIQVILGNPELKQYKSRGRYHWVEHLYSRDKVVDGMKHYRFLAHQEARQARQNAVVKRKASIPEKFSNDWKDALPEACAGLFNLNRYAKYRNCSQLHRLEIYRLKGELIELLYKRGYCAASFIHQAHLETQLCRDCGGAGDLGCVRCGGGGVWRRARTVECWCFKFRVAGHDYCWHQPLHLVGFEVVETVPPMEWDIEKSSVKEKPLVMRKDKFAAVKRLISWVIESARIEAEESEKVEVHEGKGAASGGGLLPFEQLCGVVRGSLFTQSLGGGESW